MKWEMTVSHCLSEPMLTLQMTAVILLVIVNGWIRGMLPLLTVSFQIF